MRTAIVLLLLVLFLFGCTNPGSSTAQEQEIRAEPGTDLSYPTRETPPEDSELKTTLAALENELTMALQAGGDIAPGRYTLISTRLSELEARGALKEEVARIRALLSKLRMGGQGQNTGVLSDLGENQATVPEARPGFDILTKTERDSLPECTDTLLTVPPVALNSITNIEPIGNANPPEHTLASISTDTYVSVERGSQTPLVAPGDLWIIGIQPRYGVTDDPEDHVIRYAFCKDVYGVVDHVKSFSKEIEAIVDGYACSASNAKPGDNKCPILLLEPLKAGTPFGTVGGKQGNFNFGTWDLRVNHSFISPWRHGWLTRHAACPFDYYSADLRSQLMAKIQRGGADKCGTVLYDLPGTAQGDWFIGNASPTRPADWGKLLFLGYDNDLPDQLVISTSGIFVPEPTKWFITPQTNGLVNREFKHVKDARLYCYESEADGFDAYEKGVRGGRILIQLVNATELKIEHQSGTCGTGGLSFTNPTTYIR